MQTCEYLPPSILAQFTQNMVRHKKTKTFSNMWLDINKQVCRSKNLSSPQTASRVRPKSFGFRIALHNIDLFLNKWAGNSVDVLRHSVPTAQKLGDLRGHQCWPDSSFQWNVAFILSTLKKHEHGECSQTHLRLKLHWQARESLTGLYEVRDYISINRP